MSWVRSPESYSLWKLLSARRPKRNQDLCIFRHGLTLKSTVVMLILNLHKKLIVSNIWQKLLLVRSMSFALLAVFIHYYFVKLPLEVQVNFKTYFVVHHQSGLGTATPYCSWLIEFPFIFIKVPFLIINLFFCYDCVVSYLILHTHSISICV